jgi:hypothetical protein
MRICALVSELKISVRPVMMTPAMRTIQKSQRQPMVCESQPPRTGPTVGPGGVLEGQKVVGRPDSDLPIRGPRV